jgi:hypothetical protein
LLFENGISGKWKKQYKTVRHKAKDIFKRKFGEDVNEEEAMFLIK